MFVDCVLYDILLENAKEAASIRNRTIKFYDGVVLHTLSAKHMMASYIIAFEKRSPRGAQGKSWWDLRGPPTTINLGTA